jgi:hypothetical protein
VGAGADVTPKRGDTACMPPDDPEWPTGSTP